MNSQPQQTIDMHCIDFGPSYGRANSPIKVRQTKE